MKRILFLCIALLFGALLAGAAWYFRKPKDLAVAPSAKLITQAHQLAGYAAKNGYNTRVCFLIDMQIESGKNRLFVYDLKKDSVLDAGLVTHGSCQNGQQYGNTPGCNCTSLGKYKIGKSYNGKFGLAYKLHGLDSTNSNAFKRFVVLHSHDCVPDAEVAPFPICRSQGCPTVSPAYLKKLAAIIDRSPQPILLYTFN